MEKLKIKVHPTFIVFACLLVYFGQGILFLNYLIVMLFHEAGHAVAARRLGYNIKNIKLIPFGICLNMNSNELVPKDEIKIALAGPLVNFFLTLCCLALWWIFPSTFNYTHMFCYANFVTAMFNLIPAFPLDGGRVLLSVLKQSSTNKSAIKFCKIINIVVSAFLIGLFAYSCFNQINLTFLFVVFCILSGVFENNKMEKYTFINFSNQKKLSKIVRTKMLLVSSEVPFYKICRYIDNFSYLKLDIVDENKKIIKNYSEQEFLELIEKFDATTTFKSVLNSKKL